MNLKSHLLMLAITITAASVTSAFPAKKPVCACTCPFNKLNVCDTVKRLKTEVDANSEQLLFWAGYRHFVQHFSEMWREEIAAIVETTIKDYVLRGKLLRKPESQSQKFGEEMLKIILFLKNDVPSLMKTLNESGLAKNVSNLLVKVEMVENRTKEVEDELKTEKRVRRDLEEKVNQTHTSLVLIEDQLGNVSAPVDAMVTQVEMKLYASIEDLNKTIYEDHLKKLYYQVDGVVYKNETKKLDERLETIEVELHDGGNTSIVSKFAEELKNLEENLHHLNSSIGDVVVSRLQTLSSSIGDVLIPRIETLETETVRKDAAEDLEDKMTSLINDTEMFKIALVDVLSKVQDVQNLEKKFQNFSEQLTRSLETMQKQIEFLKNDTLVKHDIDESTDVIELGRIFQLNTTDIESEDMTNDSTEFETSAVTDSDASNVKELETNDIGQFESSDVPEYEEVTTGELTSSELDIITLVDRSRMDRGLNSTLCDVPVIEDPHLLVDVLQREDGKQTLKFGCKPIGRYVVPPVPVPPRCEMGSWRNPVPSCTELPSETAIETLAGELQKEHPCDSGSGEFPDPTNCNQFIKCSHGKASVIPCPHGLRFNSILKVCDYPRTTECYSEKSKHVEGLRALIPPIHIEPNNLDRPNSLLATGKTGELIVYPRSSFTLHCLYPENIHGYPTWNVTYLHRRVNSTVLTTKNGVNRVSLTVTSAKEEDSGVYRCLTPFGMKHDVEMTVKAVICPALPAGEDSEDVYYRPTPEGELRVLGTTAEVLCEEGHKVVLQCMADGAWSREFPSAEECTPKKRRNGSMWNCDPLDLSKHPDLVADRKDDEKIVTFKCAGRMRLIGNTFTRCLEGGFWSHTSLPSCKK